MNASTPSRRGGNLLLVPAVALVVLLLVTLGATSPRPAAVEIIPRPAPTEILEPEAPPTVSAAPSPSPMFPVPEQKPFIVPGWVGDVIRTVAVVVVLALIALLILRLAGVMVRTDRRQAADPSGNQSDIPEIDDEALAATVADTVASLRQGIPVDGAVIECWRRLERVASDSGIVRRPAQTSQEFTVEVLGHAVVDAAALQDLAELYRQALFSTHQLTDVHRDRAIAALEALSDQLARREQT
ncbi:DUF4129 domain-containing protein [Tessaracoccus antarcticus]|uniref:DUF4129 domain-containing protein n=1 Tax=Tessaracoccus antarcticus TaxID=2479848 RepID=UPI001314D119|nr:DUF4129 domain-containing protein [Tessaracoccus antarcticus]